MFHKRSAGNIIFTVFNSLFMLGICFVCIAPILHVTFASISDALDVQLSKGLILFPVGKINFDAYRIISQYEGLWTGYRNTFFYIIAQCVITVFTSTITAYILTRKSFRYRNALMVFMVFTMLFNGGMIPNFIVVRSLGLLDTVWALLLPSAFSIFYIIIMKTAIAALPDSLEESIRMDGGGEFTVLFHVVFPLCKATIAVIVLFTAVGKWNEWFPALIYLPTAKNLYPLQMFLREILIQETSVAVSGNMSQIVENAQLYKTLVKYSTIVVSTLPILCIYPFVQKYFVKGVMIGSIKG